MEGREGGRPEEPRAGLVGYTAPTMSKAPPRDLPRILSPLASDLERVEAAYDFVLEGMSPRTRGLLKDTAVFGGKRLRPALTCVAARLSGGDVTDDVATVAAIVEIIHTATLVHDDVLDTAEMRRQHVTINAEWGDGLAVLVGDVLFTKAYRAAAGLDDRFASRYLSKVVDEILEGEIHQDLVSRDPGLSEAEYREIIAGKTAALYEGALVVGAHYGGDPDGAPVLGRFGHHLGMAFQMVDDRLDLSGDEHRVGKSLGRDLSEGKMTLPLILWLAARPEADRAEAVRRIQGAWDAPEAASALCARLEADGALAAADAIARAELDAAHAAIADVPAGAERTLLETIAFFVLERSW